MLLRLAGRPRTFVPTVETAAPRFNHFPTIKNTHTAMTKKILVIALVALASGLHAMRPTPVSHEMNMPCFMIDIKAFQTGPTTADAFWDSSIDGPYTVLLEDLQTNQVVANFVTFNNFATLPNLVANRKYQLTVSDADNQQMETFTMQ